MKLSKIKLEEFKTYFLNKQAEILKIITKQSQEDPLDTDSGDEMDIVQNIAIQGISKQLEQRNKALLNRIQIGLTKIEKDIFGSCEECAEAISEARLKALPDCRLCILCAEVEEKQKKQYA